MMSFNNRDFMILYEKQKGLCGYCNCGLIKEESNPHIDHIIPKVKGGKDIIYNRILTCDWCNRAKHDKSKEDFMNYIKPYLEGKIIKKDLREYNLYLRLRNKYGQTK